MENPGIFENLNGANRALNACESLKTIDYFGETCRELTKLDFSFPVLYFLLYVQGEADKKHGVF